MIYTVSNDIIDWIQQPKIMITTLVLVTIFGFLINIIFRYNYKDQFIEENKDDDYKIDNQKVLNEMKQYDLKEFKDSSIVAIFYIAILVCWFLKVYKTIVGDNAWANIIPIVLTIITTIVYGICHKEVALMSLYHIPTFTAFNKISENSKNNGEQSMKPSFLRSLFFFLFFICKCLVIGLYVIISSIANVFNCSFFFPLFYGVNLLVNKAKTKKNPTK